MSNLPLPDHLADAGPALSDRRTRLLAAARHAFAENGFKATSLRDIARDAGVSLTLVDHHFGSKEQLLEAVVANQHELCKKRLVMLRARFKEEAAPLDLARLADIWVAHEFDLYNSPEGSTYLLFMIKLMSEPRLVASVQHDIDCSQAIVLHVLGLAIPDAPRGDLHAAFIVARGALHAALLESTLATETDDPREVSRAMGFASRFIGAGLRASLH